MLHLAIPVLLSSLMVCQAQEADKSKKINAVVLAFIGRTQSDDCLIFKTDKGNFYIYDWSKEGIEYVKLLKISLDTKKAVCLVLDSDVKGYVQSVHAQCPGSGA